jgi:hypothetical protein
MTKLEKHKLAKQIESRCSSLQLSPPEWVRHLLYGPRKSSKRKAA